MAKPEGDIEKAKALLRPPASSPTPTIVYAYNQTPVQEQVTVVIKSALEKAGIKVVAKPLDRKTYYDSIGKTKNKFDMYCGGWGADWPSGSTVICRSSSARIADGAPNYSHLNDPAINGRDGQDHRDDRHRRGQRRVDGARQEDPGDDHPAGRRASNRIATTLHGSKVGGAEIDPQNWIVRRTASS